MELSFKGVSVLTKRLSKLRRNQLLKRFKETPGESPWDEISGAMALVLWTADFLAATNVLSQAQQDLIFNSELGTDLYKFGKLLEIPYDENVEEMAVGHIAILNRSYAYVTKADMNKLGEYLDLNTGDLVGLAVAHDKPPIEVIHYNLTSLFQARMEALRRLRKMAKPEIPDATYEHSSH